MRDKELRKRIVTDVCGGMGLDPDVIFQLLALENEHRDLFAWGSRPNLRRDIAAIVEQELEKRRKAGTI
ncbi:hypothetical protein [Mesorhizobium sp. RIZ17]|uniref:hypothetical protein n=1 Tax=Mesorhizobium TaxID=68287 RepID=UPI003DA9CE25